MKNLLFHRVLLLLLLLLLSARLPAAHACTTANSGNTDCEPLTDANIQPAVNAWVDNPTTAEGIYGHIRNCDAYKFNQDLSGWDVSSVTTMGYMFYEAYKFNQDLSGWDVSSVTNMYGMFYLASVFNQDLNKWNVCKVTDFDSMFQLSGMPGTDLSSLKSNCVNCPSGKYSGSGEFVSPEGNPCTGCMAGKSTFGTDTSDHDSVGDCSDCGVGTFSGIGEACTGCAVGKYNDSPGSETCTICAAGTYNDSLGSETCTGCAAGKSTTGSLAENHNSREDCSDCGVGEYSGEGEACTYCAAGKFSQEGASVCNSCNAGKYSSSAGSLDEACLNCEAGTFSEQGSTYCSICSSGKYSTAVSVACTSCPSGKYITDDAADTSLHADLTSCLDCEAGKSSTPPASDCPVICSTGTHSPPGSSCLDCESGKFNEKVQQESCTNCGTGRYSTTTGNMVESNCRNCEPGKASAEEVRTSPCPACPVGKSAPAPGLDLCPICPAGTYSDDPEGATACSLCARGTYSGAAQSTSCEDCVAGTYNLVQGSVTCNKCPAGQKMNNAADGCEVCPDGTFSNPGSTSCSDCEHTDGYVSLANGTGAAACEYCGPGFFADQVSQTCKECEINSYSVGGVNACIVCPTGTDNVKGASSCSPCPPGTITIGDTCQPCAKGEYAGFGATSCSACSGLGQYSDLEGSAICKIATVGTKPNLNRDGVDRCEHGFSSFGARDNCTLCNGNGQYADELGLAACKSAPAGTKPTLNRQDVESCELGTASSGAQNECAPCDGNGQYADELSLAACKSAPAGTKPTSNRQNTENCSPGRYSVGGKTECDQCETGKFSMDGAVGCSQCEPGEVPFNNTCGEYSDEGAGYCEKCPQYETFNATTNGCHCQDTFKRVGGICTCKAGETLMGTKCEPCETAKWKADIGVTSCNLCAHTLKGSITEEVSATKVDYCKCPRGTYDNDKGVCTEVEEGMDALEIGMNIKNVTLDPGYWRTGPTSIDIRECPVSGACVGGNNSTNYCREGHEGPYCYLCVDGWTMDPLMLCKSCDNSSTDTAITLLILGVGAVLFLVFLHIFKKKTKDRKGFGKRLKNGAKIIFTGGQITAALPSVIPTMALPENVKEVMKAASFLNVDMFNMVSVGCWTGGITYSDKTLGMTLTIIIVCGALLSIGVVAKKYKSWFFTAVIAITFLVLPTITTSIFGLFPCDNLDNDSSMLRKDYSISCDDGGRDFWVFYGWLMVLVFPIGVLAMYAWLLRSKRERLKKPVEERVEDEEITPLMFLWEPYKPEFWYWEVIETTRRLMMTGVLSTISPGTFSQMVAGLLMNVLYFGLLCQTNPDNSIAILSTLQIIVVFIASMLMKGSSFIAEGYDAETMGNLLIFCQVFIIVLFLAWAYYQKDDMSQSSNAHARRALSGNSNSNVEREGGARLSSLPSFPGGDQVGNPIQVQAVLGGEGGEIEMKKGVDKKHLLQASGFNALGKNQSEKGTTGPRRKNRTKYEDDKDVGVGPPASKPSVLDARRSMIPPAPRVGGLLGGVRETIVP
ncbi:hypothetical protein TL16_g13256, partial [Triparma laevis f. inornata]